MGRENFARLQVCEVLRVGSSETDQRVGLNYGEKCKKGNPWNVTVE